MEPVDQHVKAMKSADGGFWSRKLWFGFATSVAICLMGLLAAYLPTFRSGLETVIGGLVGVYVAYLGGNVGTRWTTGKTITQIAGLTATPDAPGAPPRDKDEAPTHRKG
jgi:hypothetical protein